MRMFGRPVIAIVSMLVLGAVHADPPAYEIVVLSPLAGISNIGAINNDGTAVGSANGEGWIHADGVLAPLADLVSSPPPSPLLPFGIDDSGRVCGSYSTGSVSRAFVLSGEALTTLGPSTQPGHDSSARALTAGGDVVGTSSPAAGKGSGPTATVWESLVPRTLGTLPGYFNSHAAAINGNGLIVGSSYHCNFPFEPTCVGRATGWVGSSIIDLGLLPGFENSWGQDVNDLGDVTGYGHATDLSVQHGFLRTTTGTFTDLGELPGLPYVEPWALNDSAQIVGEVRAAESVPNTETVAFLWQDGQIYDLNERIPPGSTWRLLRAVDINDPGQILVRAMSTIDGSRHALRLDPVGGGNPVPVPAVSPLLLVTLALLIVGAGGLLFRRA